MMNRRGFVASLLGLLSLEYFRRGAFPDKPFIVARQLSEEEIATFHEEWEALYSGVNRGCITINEFRAMTKKV